MFLQLMLKVVIILHIIQLMKVNFNQLLKRHKKIPLIKFLVNKKFNKIIIKMQTKNLKIYNNQENKQKRINLVTKF